jgi:hypothetical protein
MPALSLLVSLQNYSVPTMMNTQIDTQIDTTSQNDCSLTQQGTLSAMTATTTVMRLRRGRHPARSPPAEEAGNGVDQEVTSVAIARQLFYQVLQEAADKSEAFFWQLHPIDAEAGALYHMLGLSAQDLESILVACGFIVRRKGVECFLQDVFRQHILDLHGARNIELVETTAVSGRARGHLLRIGREQSHQVWRKEAARTACIRDTEQRLNEQYRNHYVANNKVVASVIEAINLQRKRKVSAVKAQENEEKARLDRETKKQRRNQYRQPVLA